MPFVFLRHIFAFHYHSSVCCVRVSLSGKHHYRKKAKIILFLLLLPRAKVRPDALLPVVLVVGIMVTRLLPDKNQCFAALVAEFFLWPDMVDLFNLLAARHLKICGLRTFV